MKTNTKSSITLPPHELKEVERLKKTLGMKSKVEVIRRGLRLLKEQTDRGELRRAYQKASLQVRESSVLENQELDHLAGENLDQARMQIRYSNLYLVDLSPRFGSEPGKVRPVLVIQTDLLNETLHSSTWVLPCTTRLTGESLLRVYLPEGIAGNDEECEIMIDQSRAIDNRRIIERIGQLPSSILAEVKVKLRKLGEL